MKIESVSRQQSRNMSDLNSQPVSAPGELQVRERKKARIVDPKGDSLDTTDLNESSRKPEEVEAEKPKKTFGRTPDGTGMFI
jgi:hypothetical protein